MRPSCLRVVMLLCAFAIAPDARAQGDASLTVYLKNTGVGNFGQTNSISTQVHVFVQSGFQAQYNGSTNVYAPQFGTAAPNALFNITVPNLTSSTKQPFNSYFVNLDWEDTMHHNVQYGPVKLALGANNYGSLGLGSTSAIGVANNAPPAVTNMSCYADLPDMSSMIYVYWSDYGFRFEDFNVMEVHLGTMANFAITQQNLIGLNPWGFDDKKITGLTPNTSYYVCVRILDEYNAYSDTCVGPCVTKPAPPPSDLAMSPVDMAMTARDLSVNADDLAFNGANDLAFDVRDIAFDDARDLAFNGGGDPAFNGGSDLAPNAGDLAFNDFYIVFNGFDLAFNANDLSFKTNDLALSAEDLAVETTDLRSNANDPAFDANDLALNADDLGFLPSDDVGVPNVPSGRDGQDIGGCGCSLRPSPIPPGALFAVMSLCALAAWRRRRSATRRRQR